jgi:intracellular sulfur oxidation DsrE/DsrF family protein
VFPRLARFRPHSSMLVLAASVAAAVLLSSVTQLPHIPSAAAASPESLASDTGWVRLLTGAHRQLFDMPAPDGGVPLVHVMNYYDTYNRDFGVKDADINGVLTFYTRSTFFGLTDAMWAKYRIGEFVKELDASGTPVTANPWRATPVVLGMSIPSAGIESLQKRGATFLLCNNSLKIMSGLLAKTRGLEPTAVYADMRAHVLPGVTVVPAMVIAIEQAHSAGVSYHRQ